jgi:hypothetical protein
MKNLINKMKILALNVDITLLTWSRNVILHTNPNAIFFKKAQFNVIIYFFLLSKLIFCVELICSQSSCYLC